MIEYDGHKATFEQTPAGRFIFYLDGKRFPRASYTTLDAAKKVAALWLRQMDWTRWQ